MKHWPGRHDGGFVGQFKNLSLFLIISAAGIAPGSTAAAFAVRLPQGPHHRAEIQPEDAEPSDHQRVHSSASIAALQEVMPAEDAEASGVHPLHRASVVVQAIERGSLRNKLAASNKSKLWSGSGWTLRILAQLLFGIFYYSLIVSRYPQLKQFPTRMSTKLQMQNEVSAALDTTVSNCLLSWFCSGPRAAHTFHSTGIMNYWVGCCLMTCCPCLTLWIVNSTSGLKEKLGGESRNCCMGCLCAFFCSCCVIAQDAESLDLITGVQTRICEVRVMRPNSGNSV